MIKKIEALQFDAGAPERQIFLDQYEDWVRAGRPSVPIVLPDDREIIDPLSLVDTEKLERGARRKRDVRLKRQEREKRTRVIEVQKPSPPTSAPQPDATPRVPPPPVTAILRQLNIIPPPVFFYE